MVEGPHREPPLSPSQLERAEWFISKYPDATPVTQEEIQARAYKLNTKQPHKVVNEILKEQGILP